MRKAKLGNVTRNNFGKPEIVARPVRLKRPTDSLAQKCRCAGREIDAIKTSGFRAVIDTERRTAVEPCVIAKRREIGDRRAVVAPRHAPMHARDIAGGIFLNVGNATAWRLLWRKLASVCGNENSLACVLFQVMATDIGFPALSFGNVVKGVASRNKIGLVVIALMVRHVPKIANDRSFRPALDPPEENLRIRNNGRGDRRGILGRLVKAFDRRTRTQQRRREHGQNERLSHDRPPGISRIIRGGSRDHIDTAIPKMLIL